jgi:hypothetical protein
MLRQKSRQINIPANSDVYNRHTCISANQKKISGKKHKNEKQRGVTAAA